VIKYYDGMTATASITKKEKKYPPSTMDADPKQLLVEDVVELGLHKAI
jgi:hypothetical protein